MPRGGTDEARGQLTDVAGNDAFVASIQNTFGAFQNAEDLILASRAFQDPALRRANLSQVDVEATEEANADLVKTGRKFDLGENDTLASVAVRGNALVGVIVNDETGLARKVVVGANDSYKEPKLSPDEVAARTAADNDAKIAAAAAKLRAELQDELAERMAELQEEHQSELAKLREKADEDTEKAQKNAQKESEKADDADKADADKADKADSKKADKTESKKD